MNFNLFSIIAASAISATVALPASANVEIKDKIPHPELHPEILAAERQLLCGAGPQNPRLKFQPCTFYAGAKSLASIELKSAEKYE